MTAPTGDLRDKLASAAGTWPGSPLIDALLPVVRACAAAALHDAADGLDSEDGPLMPDAADWLRDRARALEAGR